MKLGFSEHYVKLTMNCVSSVEYHIQDEGEEIGPFIPERGLKQGNPLSPYFFLMVAESLSGMIKKQEARGLIHGITVVRGAPKLTHLFFLQIASCS